MKEFVIAQPHITSVNLDDADAVGSCQFLILACDGVWDVLSDQEAVDMIIEKVKANGEQPVPEAAELLVQTALDRGSGDNISVVVVFL